MNKRFLFFLILFLKSTLASSATYYVAKTGKDTNSGSSSLPFKTIPYGYSKLKAGDTLIVRAGIYSEYSSGRGLWLNKNGTASARITVKSEVRGAAIIDMLGKTDYRFNVYITGDFNSVDGFRIRNNVNGGGVWNEGNYTYLLRNEIYQNGKLLIGGGVFSTSYSKGGKYDSNFIHHNGKDSRDHGLYLCGDNEVVTNNIITNHPGSAVQVAGYETVSNMKIYNNVFAYNKWTGIWLFKTLSGIYIRNNIIYKNGYGIDSYSAHGSGVYFDKNLFYGNLYKNIRVTDGSVKNSSDYKYTMGTSFVLDPLFVDPSLANFRLKTGSPAINKGLSLSDVKSDYSGVLRPQGGAYDIGAFER